MPTIEIKGSDVKLEAKHQANPKRRDAPIAILLHQHPLLGGSMDHPILYQAFYALAHRGFNVIRFNFRGVGNSEGTFGEEEEHGNEMADANTVLDWMTDRYPRPHGVLVCGFSFGAWIGAHMLARRGEVTDLVAVSPQPNLYDFQFMTEFCPGNGIILTAGEDLLVPRKDVDDLMFSLRRNTMGKFERMEIAGAPHMFEGTEFVLMTRIMDWVDPRFPRT